MNPATLAQSQTLATLLQAIGPSTGLVAGTVEARLLALAGDGTATAQIGDTRIALVLAGPEARQAALTPGATLLLKLVPAEQPGAPMRATLLDVRPAPATTTGPVTRNPEALPATTPAATALSPATAQTPARTAGNAVAPPFPASGTPAAAPTAAAPAVLPSPVQRAAAPAVLSPTPTLAPLPGTASGTPAAPAQAIATARTASAPSTAPAAGSSVPPAPTPLSQALAAATATPRAVAGPLLGAALANQNGLAPLLANLRSLVSGAIGTAIPGPALRAAGQILAQALPAERQTVTSQALKQAVQNSGLFMEARQGTGQAAAPQTDLKAGLVALREALEPMLAKAPAPPAAKPAAGMPADAPTQDIRLAPPRRDGPLAPQPIAEPTLAAGDRPLAVAETLLRQTDAALDRITLSQYASLPADGTRSDPAATQRWLAEVPLAFQAGTAMLPLQVEREPPRQGASGAEGPLWRVRFALDIEPMGPLQGVVTLQGRRVAVTLWAEREETSRMLRGASPGLEAALLGAQFENGSIDIHTGQPRVMQATAGQFLDRLS